MASLEIQPATYAKFTHRGKAQLINDTVSYIYSSWLLSTGKQHTFQPDLEIYYPDKYHPTSADSEIYYAIPIHH